VHKKTQEAANQQKREMYITTSMVARCLEAFPLVKATKSRLRSQKHICFHQIELSRWQADHFQSTQTCAALY